MKASDQNVFTQRLGGNVQSINDKLTTFLYPLTDSNINDQRKEESSFEVDLSTKQSQN